jgi:hypothetical protein
MGAHVSRSTSAPAIVARPTTRSGRVARFRYAVTGLLLAALGGAALVTAAPAAADGPGVGTPYVATLGDSYISGEAGRWAGNTNNGSSLIDALGSTAYYDNAGRTAEQIARCHRSWSASAYIGGGVGGVDLACSGATTATSTTSDGYFKPGLDFADLGSGKVGQARMLQTFATSHNVRMVVVSIGGNDFNFASVVQSCVTDFLASPSWWPDYCYDDASVKANFTSTNIAAVRAKIKNALLNVRQAMRNAGYADAGWTLVVQTYPSPIPAGAGFRYSQSGYTRQSTGGCGFWNKDADWANATALPTINGAVRGAVIDSGIAGAKILELQSAFNGRPPVREHRRPAAGRLGGEGLSSWDGDCVSRTPWGAARGEGPDVVDQRRRRRQDRVDRPDPHRLHGDEQLLHSGIAAPQLLGPAGRTQLRADGLQRRRGQGRLMHDCRHRSAQR